MATSSDTVAKGLQPSSPSSSDSRESEFMNISEDEGWEDAEAEDEDQEVKSLLSNEIFPNAQAMLEDCKTKHGFDFMKITKEFGVYVDRHFSLDFYGAVKLVNYIRSEVKRGNIKPQVSSKAVFEDDRYLKPVLEDDALLIGLDDVIDGTAEENSTANNHGDGAVTNWKVDGTLSRISELEGELQKLQSQFLEYRETVKKTLDDRWNDREDTPPPTSNGVGSTTPADGASGIPAKRDDDSHYFTSYSYNDIHETMLKDTVRTDAYRDFIYENKQVFKDKIVLDVGCGTGILSMFCAKAGAKMVIAVDNSEIIDKARENVFENGLADTVKCLRGKIEDVTLPVSKVDIIVSEWMGYCLLYEAMLDSVLWARDRYLVADGLMVPSHTTLHIAPLTDPDYIADHVSFWQSVYGFSMSSMLSNIYDEVLIRDLKSSILAADSTPFLQLPLHTITTADLTFTQKPFSMQLKEDIDTLDGWVIWFDTFFLPSRNDTVSSNAHAEDWAKKGGKGVAFTTGPGGPETHWRQGVLLIDHGKREAKALKKGQVIRGHIGYKKREENSRELDIEIRWDVEGSEEKGNQVWFMR